MAGPHFFSILVLIVATFISYSVAAPLKFRRSYEIKSTSGKVFPRSDGVCLAPSGVEKALIADVHACVAKLLPSGPLGSVSFQATDPGRDTLVCAEGESEVVIRPVDRSAPAPSALGSEIEKAIAWTFDSCTLNGRVGGLKTVNGLVVITRKQGTPGTPDGGAPNGGGGQVTLPIEGPIPPPQDGQAPRPIEGPTPLPQDGQAPQPVEGGVPGSPNGTPPPVKDGGQVSPRPPVGGDEGEPLPGSPDGTPPPANGGGPGDGEGGQVPSPPPAGDDADAPLPGSPNGTPVKTPPPANGGGAQEGPSDERPQAPVKEGPAAPAPGGEPEV